MSHAVFLHDQKSSQKWNDDDVEIGRCISRKLDFQCSTSAEVSPDYCPIEDNKTYSSFSSLSINGEDSVP